MTADVLVIGEALVDIVTQTDTDGADGRTVEHPGGSAANVAVALARLGRPVRFATSYGDDARGRMLREHLDEAGVVLAGDPQVLDHTSTAHATIGAEGSATYTFDLDWRLGEIVVGTPRFVHVGSIGAVLQPGAATVLSLLEALPDAVTVSYDVNARPALTGTGAEVVARVERVAAHADVVKASDEDLTALYPDQSIDAAAARLLALGPRAVVITRGGDGAVWLSADGSIEVASQPVDVVDTIGAGDTVAAAIIDALWDGRTPREVLEHATRAAAITVSRAGADPPFRHELATS